MNYFWLLLLALCYLSFLLSVVFVFKIKLSKMPLSYRVLQLLSVLFWAYSLYLLWGSRPNDLASAVGAAGSMFSLFIFWWARRTIVQHDFPLIFSGLSSKQLVNDGPFRYVRHPFYASYIICYALNSFLLNDNVLYFLCGLLSYLYYLASKKEEENFLNSSFRDEYLHYSASTGRFFPIPSMLYVFKKVLARNNN